MKPDYLGGKNYPAGFQLRKTPDSQSKFTHEKKAKSYVKAQESLKISNVRKLEKIAEKKPGEPKPEKH